MSLVIPLFSQGNYLAELFLNSPFIRRRATKVAISISVFPGEWEEKRKRKRDFQCIFLSVSRTPRLKDDDTGLVIFCVSGRQLDYVYTVF